MPEHAPAYPQQWSCPEAHTIIVTVEGEEEGIKKSSHIRRLNTYQIIIMFGLPTL